MSVNDPHSRHDPIRSKRPTRTTYPDLVNKLD
jgi:hypothetical protein